MRCSAFAAPCRRTCLSCNSALRLSSVLGTKLAASKPLTAAVSMVAGNNMTAGGEVGWIAEEGGERGGEVSRNKKKVEEKKNTELQRLSSGAGVD